MEDFENVWIYKGERYKCMSSHVISKMIKYILNGNDFLHKLALCYVNLLKTMWTTLLKFLFLVLKIQGL